MEIGIKQMAHMLKAPLKGGSVDPDAQVSICTNSRNIQKGQVFWAIAGDRFDGHGYVNTCFDKGAIAAVVNRSWHQKYGRSQHAYIPVRDSSAALMQLGKVYSQLFTIPKVAVTGSNGKTTTKDMLAAVLSVGGPVLATKGNFNNQFGVPFTLFRLESHHKYAVIEMGSNHPGEIKPLAQTTAADIAVITSIGYSHIEHFKTLTGVLREKSSITKGFPGKGLLVVNGDDPFLAGLSSSRAYRVLSCGIHAGDIRARNISTGHDGCPVFRVSGVQFSLPVPGDHNIINALLAIAVGRELGLSLKKMAASLKQFTSSGMRMEINKLKRVLVYNDCYNANPSSVSSALKVLGSSKIRGRRVAVLGDMLELGGKEKLLHRGLGAEITKNHVDALFCLGTLSKETVEGAKQAGMPVDRARNYATLSGLNRALGLYLEQGDAVLVKGSRGMHLEKVISYLEKKNNG
ncbi:MAG: UDP-N-acetylmuramoyl-tripeptide--D-alanyl-D-alanine ligase [Fibrobacteria bacterium]|nr:UDP-N-acetylmuramoyl-tripeptide--D-alanyl-D-alanine ligase [Fibrobacteria bacterium]